MEILSGVLYVVPTPIGNLDDITLRGLEVLKGVDIIFCENTKKTSSLLAKLSIPSKKLKSYHKFNERRVSETFFETVKNSKLALVSDAGTPAISDPGTILIDKCHESQILVEVLPGATALIPALVASGFASTPFVFHGFLPKKKGRKTFLETLRTETQTMIFYESPYRIVKTLKDFIALFGEEKRVSVSKEISKMNETHYRGNLSDVLKRVEASTIKGEFVVVIEGDKN